MTKGQAWIDRGEAYFEQKKPTGKCAPCSAEPRPWTCNWFPPQQLAIERQHHLTDPSKQEQRKFPERVAKPQRRTGNSIGQVAR
jgi:hypothetical protein